MAAIRMNGLSNTLFFYPLFPAPRGLRCHTDLVCLGPGKYKETHTVTTSTDSQNSIKVLYWTCLRTKTLTWRFDIGHFWGGKHHVGLWPVPFRPPGFLCAPCILIQTLTSCSEGISSSQLWWQERPQHNPLFTADSSFSCVLVDWLYIIKLQFTAWNPDSTLWMELRLLCDRLLCCLEKPDIREISQLRQSHPRDRF